MNDMELMDKPLVEGEFVDKPFCEMDFTDEYGNVTHVEIREAKGVKCPRCWKIHPVRVNFQDLCDRCCHAVVEQFPNHCRIGHKRAVTRVRVGPDRVVDAFR